MNYTIPDGAESTSLIKITEQNGTNDITFNHTIPTDCFYDNTTLQLKFLSTNNGTDETGGNSYFSCLNSTDWDMFYANNTGNYYDQALYEEGIWWDMNVSDSNSTPQIYDAGIDILTGYNLDETVDVSMVCNGTGVIIPDNVEECGSSGYGSQAECTTYIYTYFTLVTPDATNYNITLNKVAETQEYDTDLSLFSLGTHNITAFYCEDSLGNTTEELTNYSFSVSPIPTPAGGGGIVEYADGVLDYGQSVSIFTALSIPSIACNTLRVKNMGNTTVQGYAEVSKNMTADFTWEFTDEDTQEVTKTVDLEPGESTLLKLCATFENGFEISEGKFTIVGNGDHELTIIVDRIPAYQVVDAFSETTGVTGLPAVAAVYLIAIMLLIGMFQVAVTIL